MWQHASNLSAGSCDCTTHSNAASGLLVTQVMPAEAAHMQDTLSQAAAPRSFMPTHGKHTNHLLFATSNHLLTDYAMTAED
jgi:hypothetical protein